jgi:hypothetical protein
VIPTVLVISFVGGVVVPKRGAWVVGVAIVTWIAIVLIDGSTNSVGEFAGSTGLAAANAVVGFGLGWTGRNAVARVTQRG